MGGLIAELFLRKDWPLGHFGSSKVFELKKLAWDHLTLSKENFLVLLSPINICSPFYFLIGCYIFTMCLLKTMTKQSFTRPGCLGPDESDLVKNCRPRILSLCY